MSRISGLVVLILALVVGCEKEAPAPPPAVEADSGVVSAERRADAEAASPAVEVSDAASAEGPPEVAAVAGPAPGLMDVSKADERAPERYRVQLETTRGDVVVEVERAWAPRGADRFYNLVRVGFYDGASFFRVLPGYIVQFGVSPDPDVTEVWGEATIEDDPVEETNAKGTLTFAMAGEDSRTTQIFVNMDDNPKLDGMGFAPFGRIVEGFEVVDSVYFEYFEEPDQIQIGEAGQAYLDANFPKLDRITRARVIEAPK